MEGEQTLGAVTVNGSLHLTWTSHTAAPRLLERVRQLLIDAC
jgi:hypothetical protein